MRLVALSFWFVTAIVPPVFAGDVLVVSSTGPYTTIQSAILAASDYDTILVKPGNHGSFILNNKALAIVGDPVAFVNGESKVSSLSADKLCILAGLNANASTASTFALRTGFNLGAVRIEQCTIQGSTTSGGLGGHASEIGVDNDVKLVGCTLLGAKVIYTHADGGTALRSSAVLLELVRCTLTGADGQDGFGNNGLNGGNGGHGLNVLGGNVVVTRCTATGGRGGAGEEGEKAGGVFDPDCGNGGFGGRGGHGLLVGSQFASATAKLRENTLQGGTGGSAGGAWSPCFPGGSGAPGNPMFILNGSTTTMTVTARTVSGAALARENSSALLQITGAPGDRVYALVTQIDAEFAPGTSTHTPLGVSSLRGDGQFLGTVPASGTLAAPLRTRMLPLGVGSRWLKLETAFVGLNGAWHRGNEYYVVVVDSAF